MKRREQLEAIRVGLGEEIRALRELARAIDSGLPGCAIQSRVHGVRDALRKLRPRRRRRSAK